MSQKLAADILARVGPGRILHYGCTTPSLICALLQKGCDAYGLAEGPPDHAAETLDGRISTSKPVTAFDTLILDQRVFAESQNVRALFQEVKRFVARNLVVLPAPVGLSPPADARDESAYSKIGVERAAIAAGYRRHPAAFEVADYELYNSPQADRPMIFESIPDVTADTWPQAKLVANRDLHMDMTRESGPRADAHLVRYALAAEWVRPSDTVLDCACGLGYGTAVLATRSAGMFFVGVDIDPESIAYARDNFHGDQVEFKVASGDRLEFLKDNSIDMVVSFETLEHLEDYDSFLAEAARVLKPDGRIMVSVPNLWMDETGRDPNPHHHHVFDYEKCRAALARHFLVEARYAQTAPGGTRLSDAPRRLQRLPLTTTLGDPDAEWWILVASANPMRGASVAFSRPEFDRGSEGTESRVAAFRDCYDNPWLYRAWIQMGMRLSDEQALDHAIAAALPSTAPASADRGGLLAVSAYSALRAGRVRDFDTILQQIDEYLGNPTDNPHVLRWCISLEFVGALLSLAMGRRAAASHYLRSVTARDPLKFSPLIATKLVAAHFLAGTMRLVEHEEDLARESFRSGIEVARCALHAPDIDAIGNPLHPLPFGFVELAEIADMASQCANAIDTLPCFRRSPALFWRRVDSRRFGIGTWLQALQDHSQNLELETQGLRLEIVRLGNEMESLRSSCTIRALLPKRIKEVALMILPELIRRLLGRAR